MTMMKIWKTKLFKKKTKTKKIILIKKKLRETMQLQRMMIVIPLRIRKIMAMKKWEKMRMMKAPMMMSMMKRSKMMNLNRCRYLSAGTLIRWIGSVIKIRVRLREANQVSGEKMF